MDSSAARDGQQGLLGVFPARPPCRGHVGRFLHWEEFHIHFQCKSFFLNTTSQRGGSDGQMEGKRVQECFSTISKQFP